MDTRDDPAGTAPEPQWIRRTPIRAREWWGPALAQLVASVAALAIGVWINRWALPVGVLGMAGAVALAVAGRRAYLVPSRAESWRLHQTRVVAWCADAVGLVLFGLAAGSLSIGLGVVGGVAGATFVQRVDPTRFELLGRAVTSVLVVVVSTTFVVVALTAPSISEAWSLRWIGWGIVLIPLAAVAAVLFWNRARRTDDSAAHELPAADVDPLSAPDRTGS